MKREELKELIGEEKLNEVMALYGKSVNSLKSELETKQAELDTLKNVENTVNEKDTIIKDLETKINSFNETQKELEELKASIAEQEAQKKEAEENEKFESDLNAILGDKKFINDYTKQAVLNELKNELEGKEDVVMADVFNELTKDRADLFIDESPTKKIQTSPELGGGTKQPVTTNEIMNELLRGAKKGE